MRGHMQLKLRKIRAPHLGLYFDHITGEKIVGGNAQFDALRGISQSKKRQPAAAEKCLPKSHRSASGFTDVLTLARMKKACQRGDTVAADFEI